MTPLFSSRFEEVLFWAAILVGFVVPFIYFVLWTLRNAPLRTTKPDKDISSVTNFAIILVAAIAIWLGYARIGALPRWLFYPGLTVFLLGLALTTWSYRTLGRFFSLEVQVQCDHTIVNTGPYRHLRHPGYSGVLVASLGLGLAVQSWVALLILLFTTAAALTYRVSVEETFLMAELGDQYTRYRARTKRLVPYVW
jgi:protein-S-isoprenylcysteine O-methyltransferase